MSKKIKTALLTCLIIATISMLYLYGAWLLTNWLSLAIYSYLIFALCYGTFSMIYVNKLAKIERIYERDEKSLSFALQQIHFKFSASPFSKFRVHLGWVLTAISNSLCIPLIMILSFFTPKKIVPKARGATKAIFESIRLRGELLRNALFASFFTLIALILYTENSYYNTSILF